MDNSLLQNLLFMSGNAPNEKVKGTDEQKQEQERELRQPNLQFQQQQQQQRQLRQFRTHEQEQEQLQEQNDGAMPPDDLLRFYLCQQREQQQQQQNVDQASSSTNMTVPFGGQSGAFASSTEIQQGNVGFLPSHSQQFLQGQEESFASMPANDFSQNRNIHQQQDFLTLMNSMGNNLGMAGNSSLMGIHSMHPSGQISQQIMGPDPNLAALSSPSASFPLGGAAAMGQTNNMFQAMQNNSEMQPNIMAANFSPAVSANSLTNQSNPAAAFLSHGNLLGGVGMAGNQTGARNEEWSRLSVSSAPADSGRGAAVASGNTATASSGGGGGLAGGVLAAASASQPDPFAQNGVLGPWSAASAALLGDLALDNQEKSKKSRRKPKNKPKRPLSAYNIFFKEERQRILEDIPDKKQSKEIAEAYAKKGKKTPHGKIDFQSLAKIIGRRWQSLTPSEADLYKRKAEADMLRYKNEMEAYLQSDTTTEE